VAAASHAHPSETVCGDGWSATWHAGACRLCVVDGLGHGPAAAAAARAALEAIAAAPHLDPAAALRACHRALAGTRGAAVALALLDPAAGQLTYGGVGNVEARLWSASQPARQERPISYRGIVGAALPTPRIFHLPLPLDWRLLMHTDGVSARLDITRVNAGSAERPHTLAADLQALADEVLARWGRDVDDATVVVAAPHPAYAGGVPAGPAPPASG
jgi:serine phosphatase RsbU (regulator of sigma subunit)